MKVRNIDLFDRKNKDTEALIEIDINGFIWVYQGKKHGYDSWCGIPPEE